jgi:probable HAF family extracellular repeat protein
MPVQPALMEIVMVIVRRLLSISAAAALAFGAGAFPRQVAMAAPSPLTIIDLGTLGGTPSTAFAVSPSGQVVGFSQIAGDAEIHAFSWTPTGGMLDLGTFGGAVSAAHAVSPSGQIVGISRTAGAGDHAFSWTPTGGMVDLGTLGGNRSVAYAVSPSGQVVGSSWTPGDAEIHAVLWK